MAESPTIADPVASLLTARGFGAVAVIWICGSSVEAIVSQFFEPRSGKTLNSIPLNRIVYGTWRHELGKEDVVLLRRDARTIELHCHGGSVAPHLILNALQEKGIRTIDSSEALDFMIGHPWQATAVEAIPSALTLRAADRLLQNADGRWIQKIAHLRQRLDESQVSDELRRELIDLRESFSFGKRILEGWTVAIAGRPNAGKSSLINRLLGYSRSLVFDQPGTTRDVVRQMTAIGGLPVQLLDTAGLRFSEDLIESLGIRAAKEAIASADLTIWVSDLSQPWTNQDQQSIESFSPCILLHNKSDLVGFIDDARPDGLRVSLLHDKQIDKVLAAIEQHLLDTTFPMDAPFLTQLWQRDVIDRILRCLERGDLSSARRMLIDPKLDDQKVTVG